MASLTVTISATAVINPTLNLNIDQLPDKGLAELPPEQFVHQEGGDWCIRLIKPDAVDQTPSYEYKGTEKTATFDDLTDGDIYNIWTARLDQNGDSISAIMITGYRVGSGGLSTIEVPTATQVEETA